jgi:hypothetical protein
MQVMPVELVSLHGGIGVLFICSGDVTAKDILDAKVLLLASSIRETCKYAIVDLASVSNLEISASEVRDLADVDKRVAGQVRPGLIVSIVAPTNLAFDLSRMWQVLSEVWETVIVRTGKEAEAWIRQKFQAGFG